MAAKHWDTDAMRVAFCVYAAGVSCWLAIGLLPTLAEIGAVRDAFVRIAQHGGALGPLAARVLADQGMADVSAVEAALQYVFSVVNLILGLLLFARRPDELVPRLLAVALLGTAATFNLPSHRTFSLIDAPWPVQLLHFTVHIASGVAYIWAVVLFPDGTWPRQIRLGPRATWLVATAVTAGAALVSWRGSFLAHPQFFMVFFGVAVPVLGIGAQTLRLRDRRESRLEQHAVARLLSAALLPSLAVALLWLGGRALALADVSGAAAFCIRVQQLFPAVFAIVPIVLAAGVLRYRLWDIDRLLSRVLVYGLVALGAGAGYVVAVSVASGLGGAGLWSTVIALAAAAALVEPLRQAARRWANRVVFGQDLSPTEAMRTLVSGLEQLGAGGEIDQLAGVALAATRADSASVWLGEGVNGIRLAHAGVDRDPVDRIGDATWPIRYQGETLGALALGMGAMEHLSATDRATATRIAAHAGLVLHNARMTVRLVDRVAELATRSEALRHARRRLVTAQDEERYRLERDLHDGAQQALVAGVIGVAALRPPISSPERDDLIDVLRIARRDLDAVLAGPRPAALTGGLEAALADAVALAERSGCVVELDVRAGAVRPDPEAEVAVYYCCLEALQNVVKHADARRVRVDVELGPGITFAVQDDGRGLDADGVGDSAGGLLQLGARLAVLGGVLTVQNAPTGGVLVRGSVPSRTAAPAVEVGR